MGYADAPELIVSLNQLLEAERAGARVAEESLAEARDDAERRKIAQVHHDEGHWCVMVAAEIRRLGGTPSDQTGSFHVKAMEIAGIDTRLVFLNRGQAWVVRKLDEMLPRVRDARLHQGLTAMRDGHVGNIELMAGS
jgi:hypothetical protein